MAKNDQQQNKNPGAADLNKQPETDDARKLREAAESEQDKADEIARMEVEAEAKREAERAEADAKAAAKVAREARLKAQRKSIKDGEVLVSVPKDFNLRINHKEKFSYKKGTYGMPEAHANHQYAKDNGVRIISG